MSDFLENLNPEQLKAATHKDGPALVLAGAGSGKTRVLTTRVAWLIQEHQVPSESLLLVTFTNKAAGEMKERIHALTGQILPYSGTFHSISARILRRYGSVLGLDPNFTIYDSDDQLSLLKDIYKQHGFDPKLYNPKGIKAKISEAKNELLTPQQLADIAQNSYQETVATLYKYYNQALLKNQSLDFDDLLVKMVTLLQENESVRTRFQTQFEYILIDEYQDTNTVQYQLTRLLSAPQENIFVVGDFSQSIYAWRGADYRNMLRLKDDFAGISEYKLEQNYRSTQTILDAATHIISKTTEHPVLKLWTNKTDNQQITLIEASSGDTEASHIIDTIKHELVPKYSYKDIVILYRTNAQSRAFEEACLKAGVPYQIVGGFKFYDRKEIKDVLSFIRCLVNPEDTVSIKRAMGLGKRRFASFLKWKEKYLESENKNDGKEENTTADTKLTKLTSHELLKEILTASEYTDRFDTHDEEDRAKLENIQELLNVAAQFPDLTSFLENIALVQDSYMIDSKPHQAPEALTLMSLHSAKGLEYSVVFMVGMEEGILPHSRALLEKTQIEEERRLCYVGITRAKEKLYLSYAAQRWQFGTRTYSTQSRFLHDIPAELIKNVTVGGGMGGDNAGSYGGYGHGKNSYGRGAYAQGSEAKKNTYGQAKNGYSNFDNSDQMYSNRSLGSVSSQKSPNQSSKRRVVVDEDTLDGILHGEMDLDSFLDS